MEGHMTADGSCRNCAKTFVYVISILGMFAVVGGLAWIMVHADKAAPLNQARAAERAKALTELNQANVEAQNAYGWVDQGKGLVRLPISRAMELTVQNWKNPASARSNLIGRVYKVPGPP